MSNQEKKIEQRRLKRISDGLTIEERANTFREGSIDTYTKSIRKMYIIGATDQLEIGIQRASKWLKENINKYIQYTYIMVDYYISTDKLIEDFRNAMKE